MPEITIPANLPSVEQKLLRSFVAGLQLTFADRLESAVLYGSAARGRYIQKRSNLNTLVILQSVHLGELETYLAVRKKIEKPPLLPPLLLDHNHIRSSVDVFPIEFLDMQKHHVTLCGADPFTDLTIDRKSLRAQCERELKGKLLRLRQVFLEAGHHWLGLEQLLTGSFASLRPTLAALVYLASGTYPQDETALLTEVAATYKVVGDGLRRVAGLKTEKPHRDRSKYQALFADYLNILTELCGKVDTMGHVKTSGHEL